MKKNSFIEGTIIAYISILVTKLLGAIYVIPFYKIIGESGGVLYSYAYNVYNLFLNISTSGIPTAVSIVISEYNALKMFNERELAYKSANKIISIISFIAFIIMFIFAKNISYFYVSDISNLSTVNNITLVIRVISFCLLIIPFLSVTRGYLQGNKYVSKSSISQLVEQVVRIFVVLVGSYVAINILNYSVPIGVSVALAGTSISGLVALLFLKYHVYKNKDELRKDTDVSKSSVSQKEIMKKIIKYAIPVVIIAITQNIYEMIDLKFIIKGLYMIGFSSDESQLIGSIIVTWAPKICMIINSLALGLCTSIIPYVVSSHVNKKYKELNSKFNQAVNTILFVAIPLAFIILVLSKQTYFIFYGESSYGPIVLSMLAFVSILFSVQMVVNMMLQGMKKYKTVYINTITGIVVNAILDIPMILFLYKINFYPYLGSLFATAIGNIVSLLITFVSLKKSYQFSYKSIFDLLFKTILYSIPMIIIVMLFRNMLFNTNSYVINIVETGICFVIGILTYLLIMYKTKEMDKVFGNEFLDKILIKLKIKKA